MNEKQRKLNLHYGSIHGTYWMCFGAMYSFSSVFLLSRGYSNTEIGLILALSNFLAVAIQPFLADLADRGTKKAIFKIIGITSLVILALSVGLLVLGDRSAILSIVFTLTIGAVMLMQPFANGMNRRLEETGVRIAFGTCRSVGSFMYALLCLVLGILVKRLGTEVLPIAEIMSTMLFALAIFLTYRSYIKYLPGEAGAPEREANAELSAAPEREAKAEPGAEAAASEINIGEFVKRHKMFIIMCIGVLGLYFSNSALNMYMAQLAASVGGDSEDVGRVFSVLAFMEVPTLILFDRIHAKLKSVPLLKAASVGFVLWVGACTFAKNMGMLIGAQFFQMFGFALFLPSMVRFIEENMAEGEAIKGQTLFTMVTTVAAIFAGLFGGRIIDAFGVKTLAAMSTVITAMGAVLVIGIIKTVVKEKDKLWNNTTKY